eukprot:TRINITY_DN9985_c0_g1_i2.p1 TRINITY_DN9985_c0_g1~~TRINITY_DN9985_c0_g1_i2.p1  ORF type:complete len:388 (+),score=92.15 TRINITY_DN9985_c0_g1_i2:762-1925(+)
MEYFNLQKEDLNKQLNWMVLRHGKETASYEHELAVKEKRLQAMDAQAQLLREFNPTSDKVPASTGDISNSIEEDRLRHELDKSRVEAEQLKSDSEQKIRELNQQNTSLTLEASSQQEKVARLERSCAEKSAKISKYQDKIQSLNEELSRLEDESAQKEAASASEQTRLKSELQRLSENHSTTVENLTQKIKSAETTYERLRQDYNETKRNLVIEKDALQLKIEQIQLDSDRLQAELNRENIDLKTSITAREKDLIKLKEKTITAEAEVSRWRQKCDVMDKEVRVLSEQTSSLLDRDQQFRSEIQVIKIEWNKSELALKHSEKIKRRMSEDIEALRRRLASTSQLVKSRHRHHEEILPLAINFNSERRRHRSKQSHASPSEDVLWSPT